MGSHFSRYFSFMQAHQLSFVFVRNFKEGGSGVKTAYLDCISMCLFASLRSLSLIQTHLFLSFLVRDMCAVVCKYSKVLLPGFSFQVLPYWTKSPSVCVMLQTQTLRV